MKIELSMHFIKAFGMQIEWNLGRRLVLDVGVQIVLVAIILVH